MNTLDKCRLDETTAILHDRVACRLESLPGGDSGFPKPSAPFSITSSFVGLARRQASTTGAVEDHII